MGIHEIRMKSNQFAANIEAHINDCLNENDKAFTDMNKNQMLDSLQPSGKVILPEYSPQYAKRKGFESPNLFDKGDFQSDMFFMSDGPEFFITSSDEKNPALTAKYEKGSNRIFGIPFNKIIEAQKIALSSLARIYNKFVLNG